MKAAIGRLIRWTAGRLSSLLMSDDAKRMRATVATMSLQEALGLISRERFIKNESNVVINEIVDEVVQEIKHANNTQRDDIDMSSITRAHGLSSLALSRAKAHKMRLSTINELIVLKELCAHIVKLSRIKNRNLRNSHEQT